MQFALAKWNKLNTHYVIAVWWDIPTWGRGGGGLQCAEWLNMITFLYIQTHLNADESSKYQRAAVPYRQNTHQAHVTPLQANANANITDFFSRQSLIFEINILYFGQACPKACDRINKLITQKIIKTLTSRKRLLSWWKMNIENIWNIHSCGFFRIFLATPLQESKTEIHFGNKCLFPRLKENNFLKSNTSYAALNIWFQLHKC